jgi:hypothetical protein
VVYLLVNTFFLFNWPSNLLTARWKLFQKHVVYTKLYIYVFITRMITNQTPYCSGSFPINLILHI